MSSTGAESSAAPRPAGGGPRGRGAGQAQARQSVGELAGAAVSIFCVYLALGALITVIPQHVVHDLGAGTEAIGFATLASGIGAAIGRLAAGPALRRLPWRLVAVGAVVCCGLALVASAVVGSIGWFDACRVLQGFSTAAFHSAVFSGILLEAGPGRAAAGLAVASTPIYIGSALGPAFGELLVGQTVLSPWLPLAALTLPPLGLMLWTAWRNPHRLPPQTGAIPVVTSELPVVTSEIAMTRPPRSRHRGRDLLRTIIYPASIVPGLAWVFLLAPWSALQTYLPVFADQFGIGWVGAVYGVFSLVVVGIRVLGARLLDRVANRAQVLAAAAAGILGSLVLVLWKSPAGVFSGVVLLGACAAVGYGALLRLATEQARAREHGAAVSTFSLMLDSLSGVLVWLVAMVSSGGTDAARLVLLGLGNAGVGTALFLGWAAASRRAARR